MKDGTIATYDNEEVLPAMQQSIGSKMDLSFADEETDVTKVWTVPVNIDITSTFCLTPYYRTDLSLYYSVYVVPYYRIVVLSYYHRTFVSWTCIYRYFYIVCFCLTLITPHRPAFEFSSPQALILQEVVQLGWYSIHFYLGYYCFLTIIIMCKSINDVWNSVHKIWIGIYYNSGSVLQVVYFLHFHLG